MKLTRAIAWAIAWDAGNRSMRHAGRPRWNRQDYNTAAETFNQLWPEYLDVCNLARQVEKDQTK